MALARKFNDGHTDQRGPAGAPAERLVEGRAAELQLFQVAVGNSDIGRQGQALVQVLEGTGKQVLLYSSFHGSAKKLALSLSLSLQTPPPTGGCPPSLTTSNITTFNNFFSLCD